VKHLRPKTKPIYPICLFVISFGLVIVLQLRSPHVFGVDSHDELFVFNVLMSSGSWSPSFNHPYNGALGATILPVIISQILGISGEEVFKYISSIVISIVPVILFLVYRKVIFRNDDQAFLSCLVFIFNYIFFIMPALARQSFAFLTLVSMIYIFFNNNINGVKKSILLILFAFATIMLHYSTGILLTFTIIIVYLLEKFVFLIHKKLLKVHDFKMKIRSDFRYTFVVLMVIFLIFYLSALVLPLKLTISTITVAITNLEKFLSFESYSYSLLQQIGMIPQSTYSYYINFAIGNIIRLFILLGLFNSIFVVLRQRNLRVRDMTQDYHLFAIASLILLFLTFIPKISLAYNIERVYLQSLIILAAYFPVGITLFLNCTKRKLRSKNIAISDKYRSERKNKLMMLAIFLLSIQLFSQTATFSLLEGKGVGPYYSNIRNERHYTLTQEVITARWITTHSECETIFVDYYSKNVLRGYGGYTRLNYITNLIYAEKGEGIIYIRYIERKAIILIPSKTLPGKIDLFDVSSFLNDKDLIYSTQDIRLYKVLIGGAENK